MSSPGPHFDLVSAGHDFLLAAFPLCHPESTRALRAFVDRIPHERLPKPIIEAVLLKVLAIVQRHAGQTLPSLVDRFLALESGVPALAERFERCVSDAITQRAPRSLAARRVIEYIDAHFAEPGLAQRGVADALGLSPAQLSALFTNEIGLHFYEYLKRVRLDAAATRLTDTLDTVKEVWAGVGYSHASDFDHHFKARFGMAPGEFRARVDARTIAAAAAREPHTLPDPSRQSSPVQPEAPGSAPTTVLIVDDAQGTRDTMRWFFKARGYNAVTAETGEAALDMVASAVPQAILLDYRLPGMDGLECLRRLRARGQHRPAVILFTADWNIDVHAGEIQAMNATVVSKLTDAQSVESLVRSLCATGQSTLQSDECCNNPTPSRS